MLTPIILYQPALGAGGEDNASYFSGPKTLLVHRGILSTSTFRTMNYLPFGVMLLLSICNPLSAQDIESAALAVERLLDQESLQDINRFVEKYMARPPDAATVEKITTLQKELAGLRDGIGLDLDEAGAILALSAAGVEKRLRIAYDFSNHQITDLFLLAPEEKLVFDPMAPEETVRYLEKQGMAGLVFVKSGEQVILKTPFGMANPTMEVSNSVETIFAIGSRPIDFTTAAILLLDQKGKLSLDDSIDQHLKNVPSDKKTMTLRHLMTGASGLPDFFHNDQDWDADLQWVDREEAIRRMMNQRLLFAPGTGRAHSHGAFGLLAAIVELTTGKTYMQYLREHFFTPAGMQRTGEYGDQQDFSIADFAVGGGPQFVGLPNIPPNWGPTSWLIKGSGGMYSTLADLRRFYTLIREGDVFDDAHKQYFLVATADVDGSMRGFELFSAYYPPDREVFLFLNRPGDPDIRSKVFRALEGLID